MLSSVSDLKAFIYEVIYAKNYGGKYGNMLIIDLDLNLAGIQVHTLGHTTVLLSVVLYTTVTLFASFDDSVACNLSVRTI